MQTVTVRVNKKTGETTYEVNGVKGTSCEDITAALVRNNEEKEKVYSAEVNDTQDMPAYLEDL